MMEVEVNYQLSAMPEDYSSTNSQNWGQTVIPALKFGP